MDHLSPLLSNIFYDSKIAKALAVRRSKATAIVTNVIASSHKNDLANILKCQKFSILTDESTDICVNKSACIVVRFYEEKSKGVTSNLGINCIF